MWSLSTLDYIGSLEYRSGRGVLEYLRSRSVVSLLSLRNTNQNDQHQNRGWASDRTILMYSANSKSNGARLPFEQALVEGHVACLSYAHLFDLSQIEM
jgi:hypothetical protein